MKHNVLAIIGSPRKGQTYRIVKQFEQELTTMGNIDFEYVLLKDLNISTCRGCTLCLEKGEEFCPEKDDRDFLFQKMKDADGIVLATPVYSLQVTALLKNMLDRFAYIFHRPCFFHKLYIPIVTQGVYGGEGVIKYLDEVARFWGFRICRGLGLTVSLQDPSIEETQKINIEVHNAAARFYDLLVHPRDPVPSLKEVLMFRMVRSVHSRAAGMARDHQYYRDQGWFDSDYFYQVKLGVLKRFVGSLADYQGKKMADKIVRERERVKQTKGTAEKNEVDK
jgi:NAD(P)H-dependent FMN reductase